MDSLDMALDDMIKSRRNSERGRGRGKVLRGRGSGRPLRGGKMTGVPRRGSLRVNTSRPTPNAIAKSFRRTKNFPWQQDLLEDSLRAAGITGVHNDTKLYVSNLDAGVTYEDIRELFSEFGALKHYAVHYDNTGRSSGTAEVVFSRRSDAFQALERYNNVQLDGKPMKIEIIGTNSEVPVSARINVVGGANGKRTVVMAQGGRGRGSAAPGNRGSGGRNSGGMKNARGRGGAGRGRGRGQGRGRGGKKATKKSADELDKDLESYHAEAICIFEELEPTFSNICLRFQKKTRMLWLRFPIL